MVVGKISTRLSRRIGGFGEAKKEVKITTERKSRFLQGPTKEEILTNPLVLVSIAICHEREGDSSEAIDVIIARRIAGMNDKEFCLFWQGLKDALSDQRLNEPDYLRVGREVLGIVEEYGKEKGVKLLDTPLDL